MMKSGRNDAQLGGRTFAMCVLSFYGLICDDGMGLSPK